MGWTLGIDLGGTKVATALADEQGRIVARRRRPTDATRDPESDLRRMAREARELAREAGVALEAVDAVGVAVPGPFDPEQDLLLDPPNLPGWKRVPVGRILGDALGRPVRVENDANAAALAEWQLGAGRGVSHMAFLTMSTGIGGGLILDGRLLRGLRSSAGEVGHTTVEWGGEICGCGRRGCLEAYCGGASWTRRLRALVPPTSRVVALAGGREAARPEHVVAAAREGDDFARAELDRFNRYLARGLVNLVFTLAPELVVLGTIPTRAGEELCIGPVRQHVMADLWPSLARGLRIEPAALGGELADHAGLCVARYAG